MDEQKSSHSSHVRFHLSDDEKDIENIKNEIIDIIIECLQLIPSIAESLIKEENTSDTFLSCIDEVGDSKGSLISTESSQEHRPSFISSLLDEVLDRIQNTQRNHCKSSTCSMELRSNDALRTFIQHILTDCLQSVQLEEEKSPVPTQQGSSLEPDTSKIPNNRNFKPANKCWSVKKELNDSTEEIIGIIFDYCCDNKEDRCVQTNDILNDLNYTDVKELAKSLFFFTMDYLQDKCFRIFFGPSLDETVIAATAYLPHAPYVYREVRRKLTAFGSAVEQSTHSIPCFSITVPIRSSALNENISRFMLVAHKYIQTDCGC